MLSLKRNLLNTLPANSFSSLPALRSLELADNELAEISEDAFARLVNLWQLDLNATEVKFIQRGLFSQMPNLSHLLLDKTHYTRIESIKEGAFSHFRQKLCISIDTDSELYEPFKAKSLIRVEEETFY
jgi:hypothetical protein